MNKLLILLMGLSTFVSSALAASAISTGEKWSISIQNNTNNPSAQVYYFITAVTQNNCATSIAANTLYNYQNYAGVSSNNGTPTVPATQGTFIPEGQSLGFTLYEVDGGSQAQEDCSSYNSSTRWYNFLAMNQTVTIQETKKNTENTYISAFVNGVSQSGCSQVTGNQNSSSTTISIPVTINSNGGVSVSCSCSAGC